MSSIDDNVIVDPVALRNGLELLRTSSSNIQKQVEEMESITSEIAAAFSGETSTKFQNKMKILAGNVSIAKNNLDKCLVDNLDELARKYENVIQTSNALADELSSAFEMQ